MTQFYNRKSETEKRRILRNSAPEAERALWNYLRRRQLGGFKFRRQHGVGFYVLDFYCPELKLAIEVDGPSHGIGDTPEYDRERQAYLERFGIRTLRFTNEEVYRTPLAVLEEIGKHLPDHSTRRKPNPTTPEEPAES